VTTVKCASGPVFHLLMKDGKLFSGAKDAMGALRTWALGSAWPTRLDLSPGGGAQDVGVNPLAGRAGKVCVRAVAVRSGEVIVGTSDNSILAVNLGSGGSKVIT